MLMLTFFCAASLLSYACISLDPFANYRFGICYYTMV